MHTNDYVFNRTIRMYIHTYLAICVELYYTYLIWLRHRDPDKRPTYSTIASDLTGAGSLTWNDEDVRIAGEMAIKLGNPLSDGCNLFLGLQLKYKD